MPLHGFIDVYHLAVETEKTQSEENAQKTRRVPTCPLHALLGVVGVDAEERCARLSAAMIR